jgi:hypothetical protein
LYILSSNSCFLSCPPLHFKHLRIIVFKCQIDKKVTSFKNRFYVFVTILYKISLLFIMIRPTSVIAPLKDLIVFWEKPVKLESALIPYLFYNRVFILIM